MGRLHTKSSKGTLLETDLAGAYSNFVELDGVQIHYEFAKGKNKKTLLVLLHGFGANTFSYRKILKQLSVYGDVLSYDRPCFGLTVRPKSWQGTNPYSYKAQLEILGNLIDRFWLGMVIDFIDLHADPISGAITACGTKVSQRGPPHAGNYQAA